MHIPELKQIQRNCVPLIHISVQSVKMSVSRGRMCQETSVKMSLATKISFISRNFRYLAFLQESKHHIQRIPDVLSIVYLRMKYKNRPSKCTRVKMERGSRKNIQIPSNGSNR